jgi:hypothetical protein
MREGLLQASGIHLIYRGHIPRVSRGLSLTSYLCSSRRLLCSIKSSRHLAAQK